MGEILLASALISSAVGTGYSIHSARQQEKAQKRALAEQESAIAKQKEEELKKRKQLIDAQRSQLAGNGSGTKGTNRSGIKAIIGNEVLG